MSRSSDPGFTAGIPTRYRGVQYRSRLEAKWAAFFDLLGWSHQYEPFDLNGWIPDFLLIGVIPVLVEVKPVITFPSEVAEKIDRAYPPAMEDSEPDREVLIVGCSLGADNGGGASYLGWLREGTWWHDAPFGLWPGARSYGFCHRYGYFKDRISGIYDGDHGPGSHDPLAVMAFWHQAGNLVQWRGSQSEVSS